MKARGRPEDAADELNEKQRRFAQEYIIDLNGKAAAIRAGYAPRSAEVTASRLLTHAKVKDLVAELKQKAAENIGVTAERVLKELADIAFADPNELVEYRRQACPVCWGKGPDEEEPQAQDGSPKRTRAASEPPPSPEAPDPDCVSCQGRGIGHVHVHDTRRLKGPARRLYAGVKVTRDGVQVLTRSQDKALELLGQHLGLFRQVHEHGGRGGGPIQTEEVGGLAQAARALTPEQRAKVRAALKAALEE